MGPKLRARKSDVGDVEAALDELRRWACEPALDDRVLLDRWAPVAALVAEVAQRRPNAATDPFLVPLA